MDLLLERDWQDGEEGIYPTELLFSSPWKDWAVRYPLLWLDSPAAWDRQRRQDFQDLPGTVNRRHYPAYYLRNFHNQTDGYLSDHKAGVGLACPDMEPPRLFQLVQPLFRGASANKLFTRERRQGGRRENPGWRHHGLHLRSSRVMFEAPGLGED